MAPPDAPAEDPESERTHSPAVQRRHQPFGALQNGEFRLLLIGNILSMLGMQARLTTVAWEVFQRTREVWPLAMLGLVQFVPVMLLCLPAGQLVDRFERRRVLLCAVLVFLGGALILTVNSARQGPLWITYITLALVGGARAFAQPARAALLPEIVPRESFANAVAWSSGSFQFTMVAGPALGGWLTYLTGRATEVYALTALCCVIYLGCLLRITPRPRPAGREPITLRSLGAGLAFVWTNRLILAAIALDMFAVLLGGATAMIPVYADVILHTDSLAMGWLRSAPGAGAVLMSLILTLRPPLQRAGRALLWAVVVFGLMTIGFGLSRTFPLSMACLFALGAADMISVVIRNTLVQMQTPDAMRGRVSAVNGLFITASNELGEFESGLMAHLFRRESDPTFGPQVAVVSGGVGTILVVALVAWLCPALRQYGDITTRKNSQD
ncbi:MAG: MFS transporter [Planctomycetaceae bacterium]